MGQVQKRYRENRFTAHNGSFGGHLTADQKVRATRAPKFSEAATPEWAGGAQQAANHHKSLSTAGERTWRFETVLTR